MKSVQHIGKSVSVSLKSEQSRRAEAQEDPSQAGAKSRAESVVQFVFGSPWSLTEETRAYVGSECIR